MTYRAVEQLQNCDFILAEDTRTTGKLLKAYAIDTPMKAYHMHNEHKKVDDFTELLETDISVCLVSDAGTPGISDPGFLLVRNCLSKGIEVETLPGATAFVPALVSSGFPCDRFYFEGFLPHKKGRQTRLTKLSGETQTIVLYESPHRLVKTLTQMTEFFGTDREACVSREISKIHEEHKRGTLTDLVDYFTAHPPKGEIVITVAGLNKSGKQ